MGIHIICRPGGHGGVISGRIDAPIPPDARIKIEQFVGGRWRSRQSEDGLAVSIPAARLWSCNLEHQSVPATRWRARLVPPPQAGASAPVARRRDRASVSKAVRASPLSITHVPGDDGGKLKGRIDPSARWDSGLVLPFFWHPTPLDVPALSGWIPLGHLVETDPDDGSWEADVSAAVQYAVLQVPDDFYQSYNAKTHLPLGTLPVNGVLAEAFASTIDIVALTKPDRPLTGAVTGMGCVYDQAEPVSDARPPRPNEFLQIVAWIDEGSGPKRSIHRIPCEPNGQWSFGTLKPKVAGTSTTFAAAALTMASYDPSDTIPPPGGDVIAVTPKQDT